MRSRKLLNRQGVRLTAVPSTRKQPAYTYVCFVRHGTTPTTGKVLPGRAPGLHLSDKGRDEARDAAERLGVLGTVRAIYSSPMERTRETAEAIAERVGIAVSLDGALMDCDCGDWTGMSLAALRRKPEWRVVTQTPSGFRFPNGESFRELENRVGEVVERLVEKHEGEVVVVVTHADPIKVALCRGRQPTRPVRPIRGAAELDDGDRLRSRRAERARAELVRFPRPCRRAFGGRRETFVYAWIDK